jgi:hypothetical protein
MWMRRIAVIDEVFWRSIKVEVSNVPDLEPGVLLRAIKQVCPHVEHPVGDPRGVLATWIVFPAGLTINRLLKIATENGVPVDLIHRRIIKDIGAIPVPETYQALVTNSVLKGSRHRNSRPKDRVFEIQEPLATTIGCVVTPTLEALALLVSTFIATGRKGVPIQLCGAIPQIPWTLSGPYTTFLRSPQKIGSRHLLVGGFRDSWVGIEVTTDFNDENGLIGVGGMRRLENPLPNEPESGSAANTYQK